MKKCNTILDEIHLIRNKLNEITRNNDALGKNGILQPRR